MCGNTGIDADDFTDGDHGKDLFLHVNYLCKPLSFSTQILVNSKIFKLSLDLSPAHLRTQIAC